MRPSVKLLLATLAISAMATFAASTGCKREPSYPQRVMVFGIDGGSWDVILEMFEAGELPTLKRLYDSGVHGILESRPPILSPVVWSTIFTGRPWQEHGVQDWKTSQSQHRKVQALWQISSKLGLETYVLNVPSTWPPEQIRGEMVSGFPPSGSTIGGNTGEVVTRDGLARPDLPPVYQVNTQPIADRMKDLAVGAWSDWFAVEVRGRPNWTATMRVLRFEDDRYYLTPVYRTDSEMVITHPKSLIEDIDKQLGVAYVPEGPGWSRHADPDTPKYLYDHLVQISRIQTDAAAMLARRDWDLFLYVNTLVDRVSHPYWAYMRPNDYESMDPAKAARYADVVRKSYREADAQLAKVLEAADEPYWVVIVSDHGFQSSQDRKLLIGTHDFDGIYLVSAPGVSSTEGSRAYIEDVAPTVLYLLGKPVASDMKGNVMADIAALVHQPIQQVASYEDAARRGSDMPVDEKTWEQLRGLGYVDGAAPRKPQPKGPAKPNAVTRPVVPPRPKPGMPGQAKPGALKPGTQKPALQKPAQQKPVLQEPEAKAGAPEQRPAPAPAPQPIPPAQSPAQ